MSPKIAIDHERLAGFAAAAVVEVIEHLDPPRLGRGHRRALRLRGALSEEDPQLSSPTQVEVFSKG